MMVRTACLALLASSSLVACGDASGDDTAGDSSDTGSPASTGDDGSTGTPNPTSSGDDTTTADPDTSSSSESSGGDSESESDTSVPSPFDGEPLPPGDDGTWTWVDFPEAKCRDGSSTGIGVRYGSGDGLVFYFEGGGACFNSLTCGVNPSSYNAANFAAFAAGGDQNFFSTDAANPVGDWSFIYVPYCTGDVHAGARPDGTLPDFPAPQQFVGYTNVGHYLNRVVPTFLADTTNVLVSGQSAGGFGAAFNYDRIAGAFPTAKVSLLDDSGPPLSDEYMAPCLQQEWRDAWNLDLTIPGDCAECFPDNGGGIVNLAAYLGEKHKDQRLALLSSLEDNTIRFFFGFGNDDCNALFPDTPADKFAAGLEDLRDNYLQTPAGVWGTYYIDSSQHTWLASGGYFTQEVGGVKIVDWVADLIGGTTSHVAP
jgi:hypothetical protein